jgi:hypothetical protein
VESVLGTEVVDGAAVGADVGAAVGVSVGVEVSDGVEVSVGVDVSDGVAVGVVDVSGDSLESALSDWVGVAEVVRLNDGVGSVMDPDGLGSGLDPPPQPATITVKRAAVTAIAAQRRLLTGVPQDPSVPRVKCGLWPTSVNLATRVDSLAMWG